MRLVTFMQFAIQISPRIICKQSWTSS